MNVKRELSQNELDEIFESHIIEETEEHRYGISIGGARDKLLAENRSWGY